MPIINPISNSDLLCALRYSLEEATRPVANVNALIAITTFISKCMLRLMRYINKLPIPIRCTLLLNLKNNNRRQDKAAVINPKK